MTPTACAAQGIADWTTPSNPRRNNGRKGEVKSTTVSNKYDLLDDVETNLAAENGEDEDEKKSKKKGKEMGAESGKESAARPPPECVGGTGKAPRGSTPSTTHSVLAACMRRPPPWLTAKPDGHAPCSGRDGRDDHDRHAGGLRLRLRLALVAQALLAQRALRRLHLPHRERRGVRLLLARL